MHDLTLPTKRNPGNRPLKWLLIASLGLALPAWSQVYKCQRKGQTTYQSTPCDEGKTDQVSITAGPTDEEVAQARSRAAQEKARIDALPKDRAVAETPGAGGTSFGSRPAERRTEASNGNGTSTLCDGMAKQYGEAWGNYNHAVRQGRASGNRIYDAQAESAMRRIRDLQYQGMRQGCKLD